VTLIITIDGPASSGKSTVAASLAGRLGYLHLNSGLLYRFSGYLASRDRVSLDDEHEIVKLLERKKLEFQVSGSGSSVFLVDGERVQEDLTSPENSERASMVATLPELRKKLTLLQREVILGSTLAGAVLEGRDAGTVVFPDAQHKFYLDADPVIRTERRLKERCLSDQQPVPDKNSPEYQQLFDEVFEDLSRRDQLDSSRIHSPNRVAEDAVVVDTTMLSIEQVLDKIEGLLTLDN